MLTLQSYQVAGSQNSRQKIVLTTHTSQSELIILSPLQITLNPALVKQQSNDNWRIYNFIFSVLERYWLDIIVTNLWLQFNTILQLKVLMNIYTNSEVSPVHQMSILDFLQLKIFF